MKLSATEYSIGETVTLGDPQGLAFLFWVSAIDLDKNELIVRNPYMEARYNLLADKLIPIRPMMNEQGGNIYTTCN